MKPQKTRLSHNGLHLPFLEDVLRWCDKNFSGRELIFRSSEYASLEKILKYGTDRGGFENRKEWRWNEETGLSLLHEDVIIATTEEDIRAGELSGVSHSFKKFRAEDRPLVLVYDLNRLNKVKHKHYTFKNASEKQQALLGIIQVEMISEIEGWFDLKAGLEYQQLFYSIAPKEMVEVGVWKGRSLSFLANGIRSLKTKLVSVDHWQGSADQFHEGYKKLLEKENVQLLYEQNIEDLKVCADLLCMDSLSASKRIADASQDFIFLDASHDYESVLADLNAWYPKLTEKGLIVGHDYSEKFPGLKKAVREFRKENNLTLRRPGSSVWYLST